VRIWAADGNLRAIFTGHTGRVNAVAISPDGTWIATGGDDRTVRIWAAQGAGRESATMVRVDGGALACAWFPTEPSICVTAYDGIYRLSLHAPVEA
jgi:WD40 repeat protein